MLAPSAWAVTMCYMPYDAASAGEISYHMQSAGGLHRPAAAEGAQPPQVHATLV